MTEKPKSVAGNPASAQPMPGLSKRAQALLKPRGRNFITPIEPRGSGIARFQKTKADI